MDIFSEDREPVAVAVYGMRGSGKSTLVRALIANQARVIVVDPVREIERARLPGWTVCTHIGELVAALNAAAQGGGFRLAYAPPSGRECEGLQHVATLLRQWQRPYFERAWRHQVCLVAEEMSLTFPSRGDQGPRLAPAFLELINQGRHYGVNLVGVTQRPTLVPMTWRSAAAHSFAFAMEDPDDVAWVARKVGSEHLDALRAIPEFHYIRKSGREITWGETALSK